MPVDKEAELARVTDLRGFRYGLHDFLAEVDPDFLKAVNDTVESPRISPWASRSTRSPGSRTSSPRP